MDFMLRLAFRCPLCEMPFQVAAQSQGQAVRCPHCARPVAIPEATRPAEPADNGLARPPQTRSRTGGERAQAPASSTRPRWRLADEGPKVSENPGVRVLDRHTKTVEVGGQSYEVHSLSPQERRAFRRRVNLWIFAISAALLSLTVAGLLLWRAWPGSAQ
jgi:hypothetical protein